MKMRKLKDRDSRDGWYEIPVATCASLLESMPKNRPLNENRSKVYAESMLNGEWVLTGEPIILNAKGLVRDGQKRLRAAELSNIPLKTYVVHVNINADEAFDAMDSGQARTLGDRFSVDGESNYALLASIVAKAMCLENGFSSRMLPVSKKQARLYLRRNRRLLMETVTKTQAQANGLKKMIATSTVGVVAFRAATIDEERAWKFLHAMATGENLSKTNPVMVLRKRLHENALATTKLPQRDVLAITIKTWNSFRKQKPARFVRWDSSRESFPQIDG